MKDIKKKNAYYFVDEAGDPAFYNKQGEFIVGKEGCSKIYFSKRGSKTRQVPLEKAIEHAKNSFERKFFIKIRSNTFVYSQMPTGEPCLQVIDYMNWAIYRAFAKREMRYYNFVKDKVSFVWDIYDTVKYPKNFYSRSNELDIKKISLL